jgi:GrpB-like predicted nucleotidyltransferase (UPF0157 family)
MDEVVLVPYDPRWTKLFADEAAQIQAALGEDCVAVEHVGSTSIPGLAAKSVIDILVGVTALTAGELTVPALEALGYEYRGENGIPGRLFFRKGSVQYRRTHHLHMVKIDHEQWIAMLSFRDSLRANPDEARRYEALKRSLALQFRVDRQAYTNGKAEYIYGVLQKACHPE